jgi:organic radical activating enzyme
MNIQEVKQNWPDDLLHVELCIGDICNYQCWYCYPSSNSATYKWPDYNVLVRNLSHIFDYYKEHTNKKRFSLNLLGGEVTHWKHFVNFIKHFNTQYDCVITLKTNGSKKISWWKDAIPYLHRVSVSHHEEFSNRAHNRDLVDYFYKNNIITNIHVMMDPYKWDECLDSVEYYKGSKYRWTIRHTEIVHDNFKYTPEQLLTINNLRPRSTNPLFFLWNNKMPRSKVRVVDDGKTKRVGDNYLIVNRLNTFKGWECSLGIHFLGIGVSGDVSGLCGNKLFSQQIAYNIYDPEFTEKFTPNITAATCEQTYCWCEYETNMPKKGNFNKVIPIYAH